MLKASGPGDAAETADRPRKENGGLRKLLVGETRCRVSYARYYLLAEESETGESYGVAIELEGEKAAVRDLSPSRKKVRELAAALMRGGVTPVALRDVVDDWLLE